MVSLNTRNITRNFPECSAKGRINDFSCSKCPDHGYIRKFPSTTAALPNLHKHQTGPCKTWRGILSTTQALFRIGTELHAVTRRIADRLIGYDGSAVSGNRTSNPGSKNTIELSPSEIAGPGGCSVRIHINNVYTVVMFCIRTLEPVCEPISRRPR